MSQAWVGKTFARTGQITTTEAHRYVKEEQVQDIYPEYRVLTPTTTMTSDFRKDRVNIKLDKNDKIVEVFRG